MDFAFTDHQFAFRDAARELLVKAAGLKELRDARDADHSLDPSLWSQLADMGVLGLLAPEANGGLGLQEVDLVLILEESGRMAAAEPLVEHAAVAVPTLAASDAKTSGSVTNWLDEAASGAIVATAATSDRTAIVHGDEADLILVEVRGAVCAVLRSDITEAHRRRSVDPSRRMAQLAWSRATPLPGVDPVLFRARGAAATAAVLCGLAARMIEMTADYVTQRRQFSVPVGSFQAVKHQLSNALIALEHARPAVYYAAWSIATEQPTLSRDASFAKVYANEAAGLAARVALQGHGAIGYTYEHDLHTWLKRVWSLQRAWGDTGHHRQNVAAALLG